MKAIRIGICALLTFSVLAHGAVEPWSETVLEIGAALLFVGWGVLFATGVTTRVRVNPLLWPIIGLWSFVLIQYMARFSAIPFLTKIELLKFSALGILFFLAVQSFETLGHWRGFIWFLLTLGFVVSLFGVVQLFTFNGKLYWFRELRYGGIPFGPYVNRNHFAGLMELIIPSGLALLLLRAEDRDRLPLLGVLTVLPIGALFLSASRGGISGFVLEVGLLITVIFLRRRGRAGQLIAAIIVVLVVAGGLVAWLGVGRALDRFSELRGREVTDNARVEIARDTWKMFLNHPVLGTGVGTFQEVFPRYQTAYQYGGAIVNYAHNDYLQALAEIGLFGGLVGVTFLFLLVRESRRRLIQSNNPLDFALHLGAAACCCGLLYHSLVDFNLHIPSNALLFLLQAALATSAMSADLHMPLPARSQALHAVTRAS